VLPPPEFPIRIKGLLLDPVLSIISSGNCGVAVPMPTHAFELMTTMFVPPPMLEKRATFEPRVAAVGPTRIPDAIYAELQRSVVEPNVSPESVCGLKSLALVIVAFVVPAIEKLTLVTPASNRRLQPVLVITDVPIPVGVTISSDADADGFVVPIPTDPDFPNILTVLMVVTLNNEAVKFDETLRFPIFEEFAIMRGIVSVS